MSDTQARLDAIRRWRDWRGSGFPAGDKDGLVVVTELVSAIVLGDALAAELERVTAGNETLRAALERVEEWTWEPGYERHALADLQNIARAALAAARGGDAA